MKILVAKAFPRNDGFTARITNLVIDGMRESGADPHVADLTTMDIAPCQGCFSCWTKTPSQCRIVDKMALLLDTIVVSDLIVIATPLYCYTMSASAKTFLERTLPLASEGFELTATGLSRNLMRYPDAWPKKMAWISAGAFREIDNFSGLQKTMRLYADALCCEVVGELIRPESFLLQFCFARPKTIRRIETAFRQAGGELVRNGRVSDSTSTQASAPISPSNENYRRFSQIYWEHAKSLQATNGSLDQLHRRVVADVRILLPEMVESIDPVATHSIKATIEFVFSNIDEPRHIIIDHGTASLHIGAALNPDLTIRTSTDTWSQLFMREINAPDALRKQSIVLEGDKSLFSRFDRFFPPPSD